MDPARARRILRQHLDTDRLLGVDAVPVSAPSPNASRAGGEAVGPRTSPPSATPTPRSDAPRREASRPAASPRRLLGHAATLVPEAERGQGGKPDALASLRERLLADPRILDRCPAGTHAVFGEGDPDAQIMFIGEGPGEDEARTGRPFVGRAGQLLDNMIKAMGMSRSAVYITNCVHFRPPGNRTPTPDEVALGWPYLLGQVRIVQPKVIVALGGTAAKALLDTATGITRLRGQWQAFHAVDPPVPLMPTFHPAYLLRSYTTDNRKKVWSDLLAVLDRLGLKPPSQD